VPVFTITYRPEREQAAERVEADTCHVEGGAGWIVLRRVVLVIGQPREVVARRIPARDVLSVTECAEGISVDCVDDNSA
jgi:hypothetical protein